MKWHEKLPQNKEKENGKDRGRERKEQRTRKSKQEDIGLIKTQAGYPKAVCPRKSWGNLMVPANHQTSATLDPSILIASHRSINDHSQFAFCNKVTTNIEFPGSQFALSVLALLFKGVWGESILKL